MDNKSDVLLLQLFKNDPNVAWTGPDGLMTKAAFEIVRQQKVIQDLHDKIECLSEPLAEAAE